jgi:hypothetical protein
MNASEGTDSSMKDGACRHVCRNSEGSGDLSSVRAWPSSMWSQSRRLFMDFGVGDLGKLLMGRSGGGSEAVVSTLRLPFLFMCSSLKPGCTSKEKFLLGVLCACLRRCELAGFRVFIIVGAIYVNHPPVNGTLLCEKFRCLWEATDLMMKDTIR